MGNTGRRVLAVALVAALATLAGRAGAQVLSAPALANNSTPNDNSNGSNNSYDRQSLLQTLSSAPTTFQVRYASTLSCDSGAFGANDTRSMSADYSITFTVTAPAGYAIDIDTRRTGDANVQYDGGITGGEADMSAVTGSITGGSFVSGSLNLADPSGGTPDCDINGGSTGSCEVPVNQIGTARYTAVSNGVPVSHTLHFTWTQTTFTAAASGHEAAVRLGIQSRDATNGASLYPGSPARNNQPNDGHFIKVTVTNLCGNGTIDNGEQCDQGPANGLGSSCCTANCQLRPAGDVCRLATSGCDPAENCNGMSGACPPDAVAPATVVCRAASAGQTCDADEFCTGMSSACPPDLPKPMGSVCRASAGSCDLADVCDGLTNFCPGDAKSTALCRASAGVCDVAESCDGVNNNCPPDSFQPSSMQCRAPAGVCDVLEHCTGSSAACPADAKSTAVCRAAVGGCDAAENCDGVNNNCPPDTFQPASAVCRAAASPCDVAETCTGSSPVCPGNLFQPASVVCRPAAGACDVAETCTGTSAACPADAFVPASTVCRSSAGTCDIAETCTGSSATCPGDAFAPASTVCRAAAGACDIAENCTGSSAACPTDTLQPNNTSCSNGLFCDGNETCQAGVCTSGVPPCGNCDESTDSCIDGPCAPAPLACRTADKSLLLIRSRLDDNKDKLIWKWLHGAATTQADFADPTATASYALCIYAGGSQTLVGSIAIGPSASKWSPLSTRGYKYFDVASAAGGTQKIVLKGSAANKSKALLKGRGFLLPDPLDSGPLAFPVSVQLVNDQTGICWGSQFTSATRNTSEQFKAFNH